jgi:16S rRNA G966 N2-methylase RsmD
MTDEQKIIQLYNNGLSNRKVASELGISASKVARIIKKAKIARSQKTDQEIEFEIFNRYNLGHSSEVIAKSFNLNGSTVCRIVKRLGGDIRPPEENKRKYRINKDFFKDIDSEEKAYALGFMYADGNVHKSLSSFSITLHKKDKDVLDKFNSWIYINDDRVELCNDERYVIFRVSSTEMVQDLIKHGCVPAKTFKLKLPSIDKDLFKHFLRGFLDGDGCISIQESGRVKVIFTGYDKFLIELKEEIQSHINGIKLDTRQIKESVIDLNILTQDSIRRFLKWIYIGSNVYMNRKKEKSDLAISILEEKASRSFNSATLLTFNKKKLSAKNILEMSKEERDSASKFVFDHFRSRGFPYDRYSEEDLISDFKDLQNKNCKLDSNENCLYKNPESGLKIFHHFCDHYYDVSNGKHVSLHDAFYDDEKLMRAIKNRMGYFFENEAFNITGRMIRQGLRNARIAFAASIFKPSVAKFFYKEFKAKRVLDISAGFGQRMMGAAAAEVERYVATDPWDKTIITLNKIKDLISTLSETSIHLINSGSETLCIDEKFDFCFSSPPFYNKEIYCTDDTQSYSRGYDEYMVWWDKTIKNVHTHLLDNSYFVLNMDSKIAEEMIKRCNNLFHLEGEYFIRFKRGHLGKDSKDTYYVLKKI